MSESPANEEQLILEAQEGSDVAFTALVRIHQGRVRSYLAGRVMTWDIVDDLAQEVFLAAYRDLQQFRRQGPIGLWFLGIARNKLLMYFREEMRRRSHERASLDSLLAGLQKGRLEADDSEIAGQPQRVLALEKCMEKMPSSSAQLLASYYSGSSASSELARKIGKKASTLRMTIFKLRQALRDCIRLRLSEKGVGA